MRTFIAFILTLFMTNLAIAEDIVAVGDEFNFLYERNSQGRVTGLAADVARAIAQENKDKIEFQFYPWLRAQALIEYGKADLLMGAYKTPEREKRFNFATYPIYEDQMMFYARNDSSIVWHGDMSEMRGWRVGIVRGWYLGKRFETEQVHLQVTTSDNLSQAMKLLKRGLIDLLVSNPRNMAALLHSEEYRGSIIPLTPAIEKIPAYFAFRKGPEGDQLRLKFDQGLMRMIDNGELLKLQRDNHIMEFVAKPGEEPVR